MKSTKWLAILTTALLVCSGFAGEEAWVVGPESKLSIHGTTNINTFVCEVNSYTEKDTLWYFKNPFTNTLQFTDNRITIPIRNFDCGSTQISKDFQAALKSDRYPQLNISFVSLETATLQNNTCVSGMVDITLAGVTTHYNIHFFIKMEQGNVVLSGNHPVSFSDFKLKAPTRLNGLIRVKEVLRVHLHLTMKPV